MAEWAALAAAAQRLREVATQETLAARQVEGDDADELPRARNALTRLSARLLATNAEARAREEGPADGNESSVVQAAEDALVSQTAFQFIAQSSSLVQLFYEPSPSAEATQLKDDIKDKMQKLIDLEVILDELQKGNREKEAHLTDLNKECENIYTKLLKNKGEVSEEMVEEEESEKYPEKVKFESVVKKMEIMREFLCRFLNGRSGYDFLEDKDDLIHLFQHTRQPVTLESLLAECKL